MFLKSTSFAIKLGIHLEHGRNAEGLISTGWAGITAKLLSLHIL